MSFVTMRDTENPAAPIDQVELALESLSDDPEMAREYAAAVEVIRDKQWSASQVARAFNKLGFSRVDPQKVVHFRRKVRDGKVEL